MSTGSSRPRSHGGQGGKDGQARTRLARAAVVAAARTLFLDRGYAGTTIETISDLSDVPPATVYRLFSSKLGILKALLDVSIAGDDEAVALDDRPHVRALRADPDPRSQLSGFAGITRGIMSRVEPVHRILVSAAGSDPDAAALLAEQTRHRRRGQAQIAQVLARAGALRPKLRERDAADIIHALMSPEVYRLLVCDQGWPPQRYEQWLKDILIEQLLAPQKENDPGTADVAGSMQTWEAITSRRNVRSYADRPIPPADLDRILEAGWRSPSSQNWQPWDFILVTDREQLRALAQVWRGAGHVAQSAATIVVVGPAADNEFGRAQLDLGQATMAMMLAAADLGVGSCHAGVADLPLARELLGIPQDRDWALLVSLGYPADRPLTPIRRPDRRAIDQVVHRGHW